VIHWWASNDAVYCRALCLNIQRTPLHHRSWAATFTDITSVSVYRVFELQFHAICCHDCISCLCIAELFFVCWGLFISCIVTSLVNVYWQWFLLCMYAAMHRTGRLLHVLTAVQRTWTVKALSNTVLNFITVTDDRWWVITWDVLKLNLNVGHCQTSVVMILDI